MDNKIDWSCKCIVENIFFSRKSSCCLQIEVGLSMNIRKTWQEKPLLFLLTIKIFLGMYKYQLFQLPSLGREKSSSRYFLFSLFKVTEENSSCKLWSSVEGPRALRNASWGFHMYFLSFEFKLLKVVLLFRSRKINLGSYHLRFKVWSDVNSSREGSILGKAEISILKNT